MRAVVVDLLCNTPYYCGPLAAALRDAGVTAELASPRFYLDPPYLDGYPRAGWIVDMAVRVAGRRPVRLLARSIEVGINAASLLARVAAGRYDVVHVQWNPFDEHATLPMRILRNRCDATGTLLVQTAHNAVPHDRPAADRGTIRRNLDLSHLVIAQTEHVAAELRDDLGVASPIEVISHPPLFTDRELPERAGAAERVGLRRAPTVLFSGLLRPYKGLDLLADAWPLVLAEQPDARLVVAGRRADSAVAGELARLRALPGVVVREAYLSMADLLDYYAAADVVAVPYRHISQSGALMTATGLGRPVVVTPLPGLLEQTVGLESAVVAEGVDGPSVAAALVDALGRADGLLAAARRDRAALVGSPRGWTGVAEATRAAWEAAIARRRAPGDASVSAGGPP